MTDVVEAFRDIVWAELKSQRKTQKWLAGQLGVSEKHLSAMLRGKAGIRLSRTYEILRILGRSLEIKVIPRDDSIDMDDLCNHKTFIGRVSWPEHFAGGCGCTTCAKTTAPVASAYVCRLKRCREQAAAWVKQETGHEAVFVRFQEPIRGDQ